MAANGVFENYTFDASSPTQRHEWVAVDMDLSIANALRRVILTDIPHMGFRGEETNVDAATGAPSVEIYHNNGPLHNEIIAHRIGMLPIHFSYDEIKNGVGGEVTDGEDPRPPIWRFELDVSTQSGQKKNVTAHDFKVFKEGVELPHSDTMRLFPANPVTGEAILITRLRENERIALAAYPVLSTAREHAGFSPVSLCTFMFMVDPEAAANASNILDKERSFYQNKRGDPTRIQFSMETESALTPKQIVDKAFQVLIDKVERGKDMATMRSNDYITTRATPNGAGYEFLFANEDDTLGNMLQSLIYNETIRKPAQPSPAVTYVGYCCPHPLDPTMVLRLVVDEKEQPTPDTYVTLFNAHMQRIYGILVGLRSAWNDFAPK